MMQLGNQGEIDHSVLDSLFRCLAHPCRRAILRRLRQADSGSVSVDELAEYVTAEGAATSDDPATAGMKLYHTHLPMLAEKGLVEYDRAAGSVSPTARLGQIESYLELVPTFDRYDAPAGGEE